MTSVTLAAAEAPARPARIPPLSEKDLAHIPGEKGWPIIGNTLKALRDPVAHVERMHRTYGPVYRNHLLGMHGVTLLGPEANEFILFDQQRLFSSEMGWAPVLGLLFPRGLMLLDFDEHRLHRKALSVAFKSGPMKSYLAQLNSGIEERVARWIKSNSQFLFYPAIKQLTLDLAATSFIGDDAQLHSEEVNRAFVEMVAAAVTPVRRPIPGTQMYRGVQGRKRIVELFSREIPRRREAGGEDIFSQLCRASYEDGSLLSTQDIVDHMSFLMMAAHDTLTSSMTSLIWFLAKNPQWQDRLREEAFGLHLGRQNSGAAPLPYERLGELELTEMAFKEAMRINPPVPSVPRRCRAAVRVRRLSFSRRHERVGQSAVYASHARDLAGAARLRSHALHRGGLARAAQIRLDSVRRRRAYVPRPALRLHAGEMLRLSPVDKREGERAGGLHAELADVADSEAARPAAGAADAGLKDAERVTARPRATI